jgi:tRNA pseudouridine55 synthase
MPERIVTVHRFVELWREQQTAGEPPRAGYEIECGSGTYVRSLIADLGDAYCLELRRTAIGPFEVGDAVAPPARGEPWSAPGLIELGRALELARAPGAR